MDKEKARAKMHSMIDDNFEEMWTRYILIKNYIDKQGQDMITNLKKGDRFNAKRNFDSINTIEKDLINFPESLSYDLGILRSDLRNLCNCQRDRRHNLVKEDKKVTVKQPVKQPFKQPFKQPVKVKPKGTRYGSDPIKY